MLSFAPAAPLPMKRAVLLPLLFCGTAACATTRVAVTAAPNPPQDQVVPWTAIGVSDIANENLRQAVLDLLRLVDSDSLWPDFTLSDHGVILVDSRNDAAPAAYCVGHCTPVIARGGSSRVWRATPPVVIAPGQFRYVSLRSWGLGNGDAVAVGFDNRERSVVTILHEDFHLHYESQYAVAFGDEIDATSRGPSSDSPSSTTREHLEDSYSRTEPVTQELREECSALSAALLAGVSDREAAFSALHRFTAIRDARRARPGAPSFEEDFWERQEGIPTNLERRAAAQMKFADRSVIATALTPSGCDSIPNSAYFLLLGGLEAAVLDTFGDPLAWPRLAYPNDGTRASSLYSLVHALQER
jgi:hypothetical protein